MKTIGIIGYGSFGSLLASLVAPHVTVKVYDRQAITGDLPTHVQEASLDEVAHCDVVVLAVDLVGMRPVCEQLASLVRPETVVMDICSVKVKPAQLLEQMLSGKCRLLASHPMFGPNSVANNSGTCRGLTWVWHELEGGPFPELEALVGQEMGATIVRMTPDEHDRQMAWVHALTFFVGRALVDMDIPAVSLDTGYYQKLRDLFELEKTHSRALFDTIEAGNPYAAAVRQQLMTTLTRLDAEIAKITL